MLLGAWAGEGALGWAVKPLAVSWAGVCGTNTDNTKNLVESNRVRSLVMMTGKGALRHIFALS